VKNESLRSVARWLPSLLWACVIFYASSRPGSTLPGGYSVQGHLGEYFVFGALLSLALAPSRPWGRAVAIAIILASLYGITDEFHQRFVVQRTPDVVDWGFDTIGAVTGALCAIAIREAILRRKQRLA